VFGLSLILFVASGCYFNFIIEHRPILSGKGWAMPNNHLPKYFLHTVVGYGDEAGFLYFEIRLRYPSLNTASL